MTTVRYTRVLMATSAVALLIASPIALGGSTQSTSVQQVEVRYGDLNLQHPAGRSALQNRLRAAAESVCGESSDLKSAGSLKQLRANHDCFTATYADALEDAGLPATANARAAL